MARGKAAAQSANRRLRDAEGRIAQLEQEAREQRASHHEEVQALKAQLAVERQNVLRKGGELAHADLVALREKYAADLRDLGLGEGIELNLLRQKDIFIMNACRYVSMTTGKSPSLALPLVITWCTNADFWGFGEDPLTWVEKIGVRADSWTARVLRNVKRYKYDEARRTRNQRRSGRPEAHRLDAVEEQPQDFDIHPDYKPRWYPRVSGWDRIQDWVIRDEDAEDDAQASA